MDVRLLSVLLLLQHLGHHDRSITAANVRASLSTSPRPVHVCPTTKLHQVLLPSGRVITGDLACLDKQGNLILNNAAEHQGTAAAAAGSGDSGSANASSGTGTSTGSSGEPRVTQLGMVLVPKAQQAQVLLEVSLSERTAMLDLVEVGDDGAT